MNLFLSNPYLGGRNTYSSSGELISRKTPTYAGIEKCMKHFQIKGAVHVERSSLEAAIRKVQTFATFVIDSSLVDVSFFNSSAGLMTYHAISLFVVRTDKGFRVFNNNSEASSTFEMPPLFDYEFRGTEIQYFVSEVVRQKAESSTCQSFAMKDCQLFSLELAQRILAINGLDSVSKAGCYRIKQLPEEMLALTMGDEAEQYLQNCVSFLRPPSIRCQGVCRGLVWQGTKSQDLSGSC